MPGPPRPHVTIVCATSLDGKLSTASRDPVRFTSREDRARLHALEDSSDAILVGAGTIRAEDPPLLPTAGRRAARVACGLAPAPLRAIVTGSLELPLGRALSEARESPVHVFARRTPGPSAAALEASGVHVHALDEPFTLARVLETLARLGVRTLVAEGGGELNASLLEEGLVDELKLTLCPVLIGGKTAPTLFDGAGLPAGSLRHARLVRQSLSASGELFLDYQILPQTSG